MCLYLRWNVKLDIQNIKYKIINQHKYDKCHVYLGALNFFDHVFTLLSCDY
jgi:hypothetical protein